MIRIKDHPILCKLEEKKIVNIKVDRRTIEAYVGEPIAAALLAAGIKVFRNTSKRNDPRGVYCAIGQCTDCVMIVNGIPNVRTCVTAVEDGMEIKRQIGKGQWA